MLLDSLRSDVTVAMKSGDKTRVDTLRFLLATIRNAAIAKYGAAGESAMKDEDVLDVIKKQVKAHKESIEAFSKAGRTELTAKEQAELIILQSFLPKEISDEELRAILSPIISEGISTGAGNQDFGRLMKQAMAAVAGKADGGRVSAMLRTMLQ